MHAAELYAEPHAPPLARGYRAHTSEVIRAAPALTRGWLRDRLAELAEVGRALVPLELLLLSLCIGSGQVVISSAELARRLRVGERQVRRLLADAFGDGGGLRHLVGRSAGCGRLESRYWLLTPDKSTASDPLVDGIVGNRGRTFDVPPGRTFDVPPQPGHALYAGAQARSGEEDLLEGEVSSSPGERGGGERGEDHLVLGGRTVAEQHPGGLVGQSVEPEPELRAAIEEALEELRPEEQAEAEGVRSPAPRSAWVGPVAGLAEVCGGGLEGLEEAIRIVHAAWAVRWGQDGRGWAHYLIRSPSQLLRSSLVVRVRHGHQVPAGLRLREQPPRTRWAREREQEQERASQDRASQEFEALELEGLTFEQLLDMQRRIGR